MTSIKIGSDNILIDSITHRDIKLTEKPKLGMCKVIVTESTTYDPDSGYYEKYDVYNLRNYILGKRSGYYSKRLDATISHKKSFTIEGNCKSAYEELRNHLDKFK